MNYYLSKPVAEEYVNETTLSSIIAKHGTYEEFNRKLAEVCNLPEQIAAFESVLIEAELDWLSRFNITLYSGKAQHAITSDVPLTYEAGEVGAVASKVDGVAFLAVDVDMLMENPKGWDKEQLRGYLSQVLLHECTHLQQMERGDLDITPVAMVWKDVSYPHAAMTAEVAALREMYPDPMEFQFHLIDQQVQFPWELEAYGRTLEIIDIDVAYPDPKWNSLMRRIQNDFRKVYRKQG